MSSTYDLAIASFSVNHSGIRALIMLFIKMSQTTTSLLIRACSDCDGIYRQKFEVLHIFRSLCIISTFYLNFCVTNEIHVGRQPFYHIVWLYLQNHVLYFLNPKVCALKFTKGKLLISTGKTPWFCVV